MSGFFNNWSIGGGSGDDENMDDRREVSWNENDLESLRTVLDSLSQRDTLSNGAETHLARSLATAETKIALSDRSLFLLSDDSVYNENQEMEPLKGGNSQNLKNTVEGLVRAEFEKKSISEQDDSSGWTKFSEDTFTFLITAPLRSFSFATGLAIVSLKAVLYSILLASMLVQGTEGNVFGISASVEWPIVACQLMTVAITVITQDDLITALQLLHGGFQNGTIQAAFRHASKTKFYFAISMLAILGAYGLLVTFLLIITVCSTCVCAWNNFLFLLLLSS